MAAHLLSMVILNPGVAGLLAGGVGRFSAWLWCQRVLGDGVRMVEVIAIAEHSTLVHEEAGVLLLQGNGHVLAAEVSQQRCVLRGRPSRLRLSMLFGESLLDNYLTLCNGAFARCLVRSTLFRMPYILVALFPE